MQTNKMAFKVRLTFLIYKESQKGRDRPMFPREGVGREQERKKNKIKFKKRKKKQSQKWVDFQV